MAQDPTLGACVHPVELQPSKVQLLPSSHAPLTVCRQPKDAEHQSKVHATPSSQTAIAPAKHTEPWQ